VENTASQFCCDFADFLRIHMDELGRTPMSPTAMPLADAAKLLSRAAGASVTVAMLEVDIAAGAPINADGSLNLVHYAAWLVKEMARAN
jgi:hypothetical protein